MSTYIYDFNIAAFIFLLSLNVIFHLKQIFHNKKNKIFHVMLITGIMSTITEAGYYASYQHSNVPIPFLALIVFIHLAYYTGVFIAFYFFVIETIHPGVRTFWNKFVIITSSVATFLFSVITILANTTFRHSSNGTFLKDIVSFIWFALFMFLILNSLITIYRNRNLNNVYLKFACCYLFIVTILLFYIKLTYPHVLLSGFSNAIFLFFLFISNDNDEMYLDKTVGCYNNRAFIEKSAHYFKHNKSFIVLSFTIKEYAYVDQVLGQESVEALNRRVTQFLFKTFGKHNIYALYNIGYAMFLERSQTDIDQVIQTIKVHFREPFSLGGRLEILSPIFCLAEDPYFAKNGQQLIDEINNSFADMNKNKSHTVTYATGKYLSIVQREQQVIYAMKKAIELNSFEVYYQPIYDLEDKSVRSLEALLRLNDEELGFIPPDEFIRIAEKNGMIIDISSIAFRKVCEFIHDNDIKSLGIDYVEYNLSIVECDNPMLANDLLDVMNEFGVSPSQVNFEITETAQAHNVKELIHNMERLIESGSTFSMDDYGTGYSTTHYLIKLPLHIVKIDKSILWPAMKDAKSYNVLRQLVATIKSIDKKIVVEGVETQEMVDVLDELKCDYLQGYFYSKPVPADQIINYLKYANQKV